MYRVALSKKAIKDLAGLERAVQVRILRKLEEAASDPARFLRALKGVRGFRQRVGDLRVVIDILHADKVLLVAMTGNRESVYD